jgi:uncharacterized protein (DUF427 family)
MCLPWHNGPLGRSPVGMFLTATPMPERVLHIEPLRRRMSVELGGSVIARSDDPMILFAPARYPVAYFPIGDIDQGALRPADHESTHPDLGETIWFDVLGGDGQITKRGACEHADPPPQAAALRDAVAFAWRQNVLPHGPDRNLSVDELGGVEVTEEPLTVDA